MLAGAAIVRAVTVLDDKRRWRLQRAQNLRDATQLLREHYDTVDRFLNDPASPVRLQQNLLAWSDLWSRPGAEAALAMILAADDPADEPQMQGIERELDRLSRSRPDLVAEFEAAAQTGLLAAILRWASTAANFEQLVARSVSSPRRAIGILERLARMAVTKAANPPAAPELMPA